MKLRWWKTAQERAAEFDAIRPRQSDNAFLASCALPSTAYARRVALAVRRSVATYGILLMPRPSKRSAARAANRHASNEDHGRPSRFYS